MWLHHVITLYKLLYLPQDLQRSKQWGLPPLAMESNRPLNVSWQSNFIDHKSVSCENAFLTILIKPSILQPTDNGGLRRYVSKIRNTLGNHHTKDNTYVNMTFYTSWFKYLGLMDRLESIMLHNLLIMLFGIFPIFCLLCSFLCFLGMHYADNLYL